ncbi:MAG: winged helix-turn-helix transcriptional regulator, partial [Bacteroidales bacterium]|nr:winged helix-turn-helix transcriptional regulator [Bacteroidales bacterium]
SQREIANKYGLDRSTVHRYIKRFLNATDGK